MGYGARVRVQGHGREKGGVQESGGADGASRHPERVKRGTAHRRNASVNAAPEMQLAPFRQTIHN